MLLLFTKLLLLDGEDITIGVSFSTTQSMILYTCFISIILSSIWKCIIFRSVSVCQANEPGLDSNSMRMTYIAWLYYINKYIELLDTVFFVMRKKWNQVTFLHVYHHAIMPIWAYNQVNWLK